jgi:hypothetical protein
VSACIDTHYTRPNLHHDTDRGRLSQHFGSTAIRPSILTIAVTAGVFTEGHAPLSGLDELIRVTRAGGCIVCTISRTYQEGKFDEKGGSLEAAGRWRFVDASQRNNSTPLEGELSAKVLVYRVI